MSGTLQQVGSQMLDSLHKLPFYLSRHILISAVSLGIGIAISLPLAIIAAGRKRLRWPMLTIASVIQTVPSIALLALVYAVLLGMTVLIGQWTGLRIAAVSFITTIIAMTLYSMLPVMRNTVTGLLGVDDRLLEAARGVGMTPRQVLWKVQLPLAAPVILAGIRTATVWVVGIATLSTPVGQTSLGDYIFTGLQLQNWGSVLLGCIAAAVLAILLDMLIALLQQAAERRSAMRAIIGCLGLLVVIGGGGAAPALFHEQRPDASARRVVVGAKTFDEQFILASMIRDRLNAAGFDAGKQQGLGSTFAFNKLANNQIDCYVDYSGTLWAVQMKRKNVEDSDAVLSAVTKWCKDQHDITCMGRLGFANAYALVMKRTTANRLGIHSIADLAKRADSLSIGGDYEFFDRPEWKHIRDTYGLHFNAERKFQSTLMYKALVNDEVDVISAFSSDGRIAAYDLMVLSDPRHAIPPYDAILLVSPEAAKVPGFLDSLKPLISQVSDDLMRQANYRVDRDDDQKKSPDQAAKWLEKQMIGKRPLTNDK